jgi:diaminopimelate decarboxylase
MSNSISDNIFSTTRTHIAALSIKEIASQFSTPTFVYDAEVILRRVAELSEFDVVRYAQKANSNLAILAMMKQQGVVLDAVSAGEIHRALRVGYRGGSDVSGRHEIVYTADIFDQDALTLVQEHNIHVNCGSVDMIEQLGKVMPGVEITLRINPGFGHGHSEKTNTGGSQSKHGIWHEQLAECKMLAAQYDIIISGLHMHIGSGCDMEHLSLVCGAMEKAVSIVGDTVRTISTGGGLPIPYSAEEAHIDLRQFYALWNAARQRIADQVGHEVCLEIEPGRFLVAECGFLVTQIRSIKTTSDKRFYLVDAGFNNLARPIMYGSYHPISIAVEENENREHVDVVVGGPLCESGDIFTQQEGGFVCTRSLPDAQVGEYLVLECAGAYGSVMGSNYNSKLLAAEVMIYDGMMHLIRRRQTYDALMVDERVLGT